MDRPRTFVPLLLGCVVLAVTACGLGAPATPSEAAKVVATAAPALASTAIAAGSAVASSAINPELESALSQANAVFSSLKFQVEQRPDSAPPEQVTRLTLRGTDATGAFKSLDRTTKQSAATAAITATAGIYPKATVELNVLDASGKQIVTGLKQPMGQAVVSVLQ